MENKYPVADLIANRRTIRKFKEENIPNEVLNELLQVASWAPNHKLKEPWRFIVYSGDGSKALGNIIYEVASNGRNMKKNPEEMKKYFLSIPTHILVVMPEDPQPLIKEEDYAAVCALIQNFQLAAWERGIGVFWKSDAYLTLPSFREAVGVLPGEKIVAILHVGYPEMIPNSRPRTSVEEKITLINSEK